MELMMMLMLTVLLISTGSRSQPSSSSLEVQFYGPLRNVNEGTTASLRCTITCSECGIGRYQAIHLQILHNRNEIINIKRLGLSTAYSGRYELRVEGTEPVDFLVHLDIPDVRRNESGMYTCRGTHTGLLIPSSEAEATTAFDVNYLPKTKYPFCSPRGVLSPELVRGDNVTFLCSSRTGKPAVDLNWLYADGTRVISELLTMSEDFVQYELTVAVMYTANDKNATFRCEATSTAFPDYRSSCAVNLLNVAPPTDDETTASGSESLSSPTLPSDDINITQEDDQTPMTSSSLASNSTPMMITIIVLALLLLLSVALNIIGAMRRRRTSLPEAIPETNPENNYQGLTKVEQRDPYMSLTTPPKSLKTINKKSNFTEPIQQTKVEEDYAQVDLSPNSLQNETALNDKEDSKYVNYKRKPRKV